MKNLLSQSLALVLFLPLLSQCGKSSSNSDLDSSKSADPPPTSATTTAEMITATIAEYTSAYNDQDIDRLAVHWSEDSVVNTADGKSISGREAIVAALQEVFANSPEAKLIVSVDSIESTDTETASAMGWAFTSAAGTQPVLAKYKADFQKGKNGWQLSAFTNENPSADPMPVPNPSDQMKPLAWLIGTWIDQATDSTITYYTTWGPGGKHLLRSFAEESADGIKNAGHEIIEWNEQDRSFTSLTFDASDTVTRAVWTPEGESTWTRSSTATLKNGKKATATQRIRKVDDNSYRFDIIDQTIDGKALPDAIEITVTRIDQNN
ncbi:MAG: SgcJ/EcaC family oxidoreductase [Verrucomicrobiota bacterium]